MNNHPIIYFVDSKMDHIRKILERQAMYIVITYLVKRICLQLFDAIFYS